MSESDSIEHSGPEGAPIPIDRPAVPAGIRAAEMEELEFSQVVGSRRVYHLDIEHDDGVELPLGTKPSWEMSHFLPDGSPAPSSIGILETSVNCRTGRIIAGARPGYIVITVNANVSATSHASTTFKIHVKPHPTTSSLLKFKVASHRDAPIH